MTPRSGCGVSSALGRRTIPYVLHETNFCAAQTYFALRGNYKEGCSFPDQGEVIPYPGTIILLQGLMETPRGVSQRPAPMKTLVLILAILAQSRHAFLI